MFKLKRTWGLEKALPPARGVIVGTFLPLRNMRLINLRFRFGVKINWNHVDKALVSSTWMVPTKVSPFPVPSQHFRLCYSLSVPGLEVMSTDAPSYVSLLKYRIRRDCNVPHSETFNKLKKLSLPVCLWQVRTRSQLYSKCTLGVQSHCRLPIAILLPIALTQLNSKAIFVWLILP